MSRTPSLATPLLALALLAPPGAHAADNGFYLGGSVGRANVDLSDAAIGFDEDDTGWKVFVGIRPIDLVAAEVSYTDFGRPAANVGAVRAEYERFKTDAGDPDFISIGVAWPFL